MKILGLSFDYHDSSAALIIDDNIIAAAQEERFSRVKHDAVFPKQAIEFCLKKAGIDANELDAVAYYENPALKFSRILKTTAKNAQIFKNIYLNWIVKRKFEVSERIVEVLQVDRNKIFYMSHHESHASATYFCSPFSEATIITLDGAGEYETITVSVGKDNSIQKIYSATLPNSLGLLYSAFTAFLGFEVNEGEYKVMGMSAFGSPEFYKEVSALVQFDQDGRFALSEECFNFFTSEEVPYTEKMEEIFGPPRAQDSDFDVGNLDEKPTNKLQRLSRHYANVASSLQKVTEEIILSIVKFGIEKTGINNVCLAGGVALNSLANGKIQSHVKGNLYVHPAAGDAGSALGAALAHYHAKTEKKMSSLDNVYLGEDYTNAEVRRAFKKEKITRFQYFENDSDLYAYVSGKIVTGNVIGWFQGRFEWGPRALGARSILADPSNSSMKSIVNNKIKFREPFRPFAPSVLEEKAADFFDGLLPRYPESPEYFMLSVVDVKPEKQDIIPAVTHVDGTARIQLVRKKTNARYYNLIAEFEKVTGIPMLLNTSFNLKGEPVVASPMDALKTFYWCDLDLLVINNFVVAKESF